MKPILLLIVPIIASASGDTNSNELFPSLIEDRRCFAYHNLDSELYHRWTMSFDSKGFSTIGNAIYLDNTCTILSEYKSSPFTSRYPYIDGEKVINADGSTGKILLFPNPEGALPYGTVYISRNNEICFAKNTISVSQDGFSFSPTSKDGDFSNLEIDTKNCLTKIE